MGSPSAKIAVPARQHLRQSIESGVQIETVRGRDEVNSRGKEPLAGRELSARHFICFRPLHITVIRQYPTTPLGSLWSIYREAPTDTFTQ